MAPHLFRHFCNPEDARRRRSITPSYNEKDDELSYSRVPVEKKDFFNSIGLRMKRVRYDQFFEGHEEQQREVVPIKKRKVEIPVGVHLRECSVVIQGVWCKICGRDFKCSTDLISHIKIRHKICEDSFSSDVYSDLSSEQETDVSRTNSPLLGSAKIQRKKERRKRMSRMRLVLKMGKEILGNLFIKRKHLKSDSSSGFAPKCEFTETETEDYEHTEDDSGVSGCEESLYSNSTVNCIDPTLHHTANPHNDLETEKKVIGTFENTVSVNSPVSLPEKNIEEPHPLSGALNTTCTITPVDSLTDENRNSPNLSNATRESVIVKQISGLNLNSEAFRTSNSLSRPSVLVNHPMTAGTGSTTHVETSTAINATGGGKYRDLCITRVHNRPSDVSNDRADTSVTKQSPVAPISHVQNYMPTNNPETTRILLGLIPNGSTEIRPNVFVRPVVASQPVRPATQSPPGGNPTASVNIQLPKTLKSQAQPPKEWRKSTASVLQEWPSAQERGPQTVSGYYAIPITTNTNQDTCDDEIQEILRINRGKVPESGEINHESPSRLEREHLQVADAINDMIRMEERGFHLLAEKGKTSKNKKRVSSGVDFNSNTKKSPQQKKIRESAAGVPKVPNPQKSERAKAQSSAPEMPKENVPTEPKSPLQLLQNYVADYPNQPAVLPSDNNATSHQSHNSGRVAENNGNKTVILIDLVDDED